MTFKKLGHSFLILIIVTGWIFSSWPSIYNFPPEVQRAYAAEIQQYTGGLLVYADGTAGTPKYKVFDDTTGFGAEQSASSVGSSAIEWIRVAASPTNDEWIIATRDSGDVIKAQVCTGVDGGVSCGTPTQITATAGTHGFRNYDVAYERTSGDALLVYGNATADMLRKIEWTGGAWTSDAQIITNRTSGTVEWVELTSRNASDQIGIAYSDTNDYVSAYRWSGTAVADEATSAITTVAVAANVRKFDVTFEHASGDMFVAATYTTGGAVAYGQLVGTTWTVPSTNTTPDMTTAFLDLPEQAWSSPGGDDLAVSTHGVATSANTTEGYGWTGTAISDGTAGDDVGANWVATSQLSATSFFNSTYYGVTVISSTVSGTDDIEWWTMNGSSVITDQTVNTRTRGASYFIDLFDYPAADKVLLLTADANSDLWADTWAGATGASAWTNITSGGALETSLASAATDVVDFAFRLAPLPSTVDQSASRFFLNADSTNVGNYLGTQDSAVTLGSYGAAFRLRTLLHVSINPLNTNGLTFKLQFVGKGTGTCAAPTGGTPSIYTDVTASTDIAYNNNTTPSDGATLIANTNDPTHNADTLVNQTYEELNNFTNSVANIPVGQDGKWDFSLKDNNVTTANTYCFRVVQSDDTLLNSYVYPEITTAGQYPTQLAQYESDHSTAIAVGDSTFDTTVYSNFNVFGSGSTDVITPKVEVRDTSTSFSNTVTNTGDAVQYDASDPPGLRSSCSVYDELNDRLVMWGGYMGGTTKANTNDTWVLSLKENQRSQWEKITVSGTPPQINRAHVCVYDSLNDRIVVYGGWTGSVYLTSAWALTLPASGTPTWSQLSVSGTPPNSGQQLQACATYDPSPSRMIVYGGFAGSTWVNTVYQLTLPSGGTPTWSQLIGTTVGTPSATGAGRDGQTCVYDTDSDRMVMYGGSINSSTAYTNEIWYLNLVAGSEAWTQIVPYGNAGARTGHFAAIQPDYYGTDDRMIMFAGYPAAAVKDVWELRLPELGGAIWTEKTPITGKPGGRGFGASPGIWDPLNERAIFVGGYDGTNYYDEPVSFTPTSSGNYDYQIINPIHYLQARDAEGMVFDSTNNQMVMFGGASRGTPAWAYHISEAWKMNTSGTPVWKDIGTDVAPLPREMVSMVYDPLNNRAVTCYGLENVTVMDDCWGLSLSSSSRSIWTNLNPSGTVPPARWGATYVYDDLNDEMVTFGGGDNVSTYFNTTYFLSLPNGGGASSWVTKTISGTPPTGRFAATAVYDPGRDRMIVFGGLNGSTYYNNTYALTLPSSGNPTWTLLAPTGTLPGTRRGQVAVYDPDRGDSVARMIIFGGWNGSTHYNDVWELTLPASGDGVWTQLSPTGTLPLIRRTIGAAYDSVNDQMIIMGGRDTTQFFGDTWALALGSSTAWTNLTPQITVPASVALTSLSTGTSYHWQSWWTGSVSGDSQKMPFGNNSDAIPADVDFSIASPPAPVFDQKSYRFENIIGNFVGPIHDTFQDQTTLADTARTDVKIGERLFLRINVENSGGTGSKQFKIQFGAGATCSSVTYSDVGPSTAISYADGLTGEWGDLGVLGQTVYYPKTNASTTFSWSQGVFVKNSNLTSATSIGNNQFSEFVFLLDTLNATAGTKYCFRLYNTTDSAVLNTYTSYPALTVVSSANDTQKFSKNISVTAPANTDSPNIFSYRLGDEGYQNLVANDTSEFASTTKQTTSAYNKMYIRLQVYGNKIYYVWHEYDASTIYQIWTAYSNLDGTGFVATQQTSDILHEHSYPQLQVYGSKIYYVGHFWDGADDQVWLATTNLDGTGWTYTQLTYTTYNTGYPQFQVYGDKIYYVWQERDVSNNWHIWTANSNLDGTGLIANQRTDGTYNEGYPQLQVYGSKIYYVWQKIDAEVGTLGTPWDIWTGNSNLDGTDFTATMQFTSTKLVTTSIYHRGFPQLQVYGSKIYYTWHQHDSTDYIFWTANSNLDGTGWSQTARESDTVAKFYSELQVYGSKIYYTWREFDGAKYQIWVANSNLDGTNWIATQQTTSAYDKYNPQLQVYGSKIYYTWYEYDGAKYQAWTARAIFGDRVENATPPSGYNQFLFKQKNSNLAYDQISVSWDGRASITVPTPTIALQIYNNTTTLWENLATSNTYSANTDFTLTGSKTTSLSSYYDANYFITLRITQSVSEGYLETDYLLTTFTPATISPSVADVQLNSQANIDLTESTTTSISATADVSDPQGCSTITNVTAKIYRSGVTNGSACTANDNNCYSVASCTQNTCVGTDATYTCTINMQFFADPTDTGTPWSSEYWKAWIEATDGDSNVGSAYNTNGAPEVNSLLALSVTTTISYGNFDPGSSSTTLDKQTIVTSTGNISLDVNLYGSSMISGGNTIAVGQQKYSLSASTPYGSGIQLLVSPGANAETNMCKNTSTTKETDDIWWGIAIPDPQPTGTYSGSNTFSAVKNAWAIPGDWCE